jgi:hypothetical protein
VAGGLRWGRFKFQVVSLEATALTMGVPAAPISDSFHFES